MKTDSQQWGNNVAFLWNRIREDGKLLINIPTERNELTWLMNDRVLILFFEWQAKKQDEYCWNSCMQLWLSPGQNSFPPFLLNLVRRSCLLWAQRVLPYSYANELVTGRRWLVHFARRRPDWLCACAKLPGRTHGCWSQGFMRDTDNEAIPSARPLHTWLKVAMKNIQNIIPGELAFLKVLPRWNRRGHKFANLYAVHLCSKSIHVVICFASSYNLFGWKLILPQIVLLLYTGNLKGIGGACVMFTNVNWDDREIKERELSEGRNTWVQFRILQLITKHMCMYNSRISVSVYIWWRSFLKVLFIHLAVMNFWDISRHEYILMLHYFDPTLNDANYMYVIYLYTCLINQLVCSMYI